MKATTNPDYSVLFAMTEREAEVVRTALYREAAAWHDRTAHLVTDEALVDIRDIGLVLGCIDRLGDALDQVGTAIDDGIDAAISGEEAQP